MGQKKIAVLVGDKQDEALRMGLGITLEDDIVDIYVLDKKVEENEKNTTNIEVMKDLELLIYTNCKENSDMKYLTNQEIAQKLVEYDHVVPY